MKEFNNIGVIGEGKMGSSIFFFLLSFPFELVWLCSSDIQRELSEKTFRKKTRLLNQSGVMIDAEYIFKAENTKITSNADDLKNCDLIIEAITEDVVAKNNLFTKINESINPECIFTTNSSSIIPSSLSIPDRRKEKFAGLHFFYPVPYKSIVEIITASYTSTDTSKALSNFIININKRPFLQKEEHASILNRLFLDFQAEACNISEEGILSFKEIDELVRRNLFPIGVFEFFDHVGIDIMLSSVKSFTRGKKDKGFYKSIIIQLESLMKENRLGIKTKHGFYDYRQSVNGQSIAGNFMNNREQYEHQVIDRLWKHYIESVNFVIDEQLCSREDLTFAVKDYMGMDSDPFIRKPEI